MGTLLGLKLSRVTTHAIDEIVDVVQGGGILLYPTDTIYGLGCNAFDPRAVKRVFAIKRRRETNPTLVLADGKRMVKDLVEEIPPLGAQLMKAFWPGPMTLIFFAKEELPPLIRSASGKVAIRVPANRFCLQMVKSAGVPIVSTSANISGQPASPDIESLRREFLPKVDLFVDAGTLPTTTPSTIIDVTGEKPEFVREGALSAKRILGSLRREP